VSSERGGRSGTQAAVDVDGLTSTLTANVEVEGDVDIDPTVDLDLDHRSQCFDEDPETTGRSTYNVDGRVHVVRRRSGQRLATTSRST
jgi:hypothetical protein